MREEIIRAYWDCTFCGTRKIDGLKDVCPNCAKRKSAGTKCYIDDNPEDDVLTESELNAAGITAEECDGQHKEWACAYCGQFNNYADSFCNACGASKEEKTGEYGDFDEDGRLKDEVKDRTDNISADDFKDYMFVSGKDNGTDDYIREKMDLLHSASEYKEETPQELFGLNSEAQRNIRRECLLEKIKYMAVPVVLMFGLIFLLLFSLWPQKKVMTVTGFEWERNITVEEYKTLDESGWSLPADARLEKSQQEFYGYTQVLDHYETKTREKSRQVIDHYEDHTSYTDNGNGTYTKHTYQTPVYKTEYYTETYQDPVYRDEPVYKTKYYYEIDRWVGIEDYSSSGQNKEPYWNENYELATKQRDTARTEEYSIIYSGKDGELRYDAAYDEWMEIELGDEAVITTCRLGIVYGQEGVIPE